MQSVFMLNPYDIHHDEMPYEIVLTPGRSQAPQARLGLCARAGLLKATCRPEPAQSPPPAGGALISLSSHRMRQNAFSGLVGSQVVLG